MLVALLKFFRLLRRNQLDRLYHINFSVVRLADSDLSFQETMLLTICQTVVMSPVQRKTI